MKYLLFLLLFPCGAIFAMQENLELDRIALQEFLNNKKQIIQASQNAVSPSNPLFKRYINLSTLDEIAAAQEYAKPALQEKAKSFYTWLSSKPVYQNGLAHAKEKNTTEAWDAFRKGNAPLIMEDFQTRGINPATASCEAFFNANAHLSEEQIEYVVAQSFVIYYIRQLQRQQTAIAPSAIQIK